MTDSYQMMGPDVPDCDCAEFNRPSINGPLAGTALLKIMRNAPCLERRVQGELICPWLAELRWLAIYNRQLLASDSTYSFAAATPAQADTGSARTTCIAHGRTCNNNGYLP